MYDYKYREIENSRWGAREYEYSVDSEDGFYEKRIVKDFTTGLDQEKLPEDLYIGTNFWGRAVVKRQEYDYGLEM